MGVGVDQEVARYRGARDRPVVFLPREYGGLRLAAVALDGVQVHAAFDEDARVRVVEAYALDCPDVLLLVHELRVARLRAGVEPNAVVHARRQVLGPERHEVRFHVRLKHNLLAALVGALDDGHLSQRREVGEPRAAGRRERGEPREVAVDPARFCTEGQQLTVLGPVHVSHLALGADLDSLALHLLPVLHADDPDAIVARGRHLPSNLAAAEAVQAVLVVLHGRQLLGDLPHLGANDHYEAEGEAQDKVAVAKPAVALDGAVLRLEGKLRRLLGLPQAEEQEGDLPEDDAQGLLAARLVRVLALDVGELDVARLALKPQGRVFGLQD
mmetsp:Transcript_26836/g.75886  ORF Transcript_26836/g.75886 Transcript_26836/m.75886 type:complete len:328 (+) Transcript_26836:2737-3720(+)